MLDEWLDGDGYNVEGTAVSEESGMAKENEDMLNFLTYGGTEQESWNKHARFSDMPSSCAA